MNYNVEIKRIKPGEYKAVGYNATIVKVEDGWLITKINPSTTVSTVEKTLKKAKEYLQYMIKRDNSNGY